MCPQLFGPQSPQAERLTSVGRLPAPLKRTMAGWADSTAFRFGFLTVLDPVSAEPDQEVRALLLRTT